ncbi:hypothetical protein P5673_016153 [Acropora cervicornis]|uniref:Uncharacterized protein n=1 Tax=Acropora cervicornis TaxID=6130 RepID=A0AAD9QGT4_ACRCE|nr:hypothetical protein P5673_016153 [Acropora cervicornis]
MVDDTSGISTLNNSSQTLSGQTEWVTFSEHDQEPMRVESTAKERPPEENGRYLSRLEKELQRLQEKKRKQLSSKDMIKTLQEAKESQMKEFMENDDLQETFLINESDIHSNSCCFPVHRAFFPKQPLNNEELECLVDTNDTE